MWCAAGVNLSGGRTRDGACIVGESVFYSQSDCAPAKDSESLQPHIAQLEQELQVILFSFEVWGWKKKIVRETGDWPIIE